ncbi:hypothetical protein ABZ647_11095 [Micromonospora aurantiaca]|uniref:hypothetical protein n=1 Tax=Micromonospora aurantiaca (nom. illeg.) TaxID=47850 RepID=UPI0033D31AE9
MKDYLDRNMWVFPVLTFIISETALIIWGLLSSAPILLSAAKPEVRQQFYSSLTGTSSSLLGFSVASVAILAAFAPRKTENGVPDGYPRGAPARLEGQVSEEELAEARGFVAVTLLVTSFFLLLLLIAASVALSLQPKHNANPWLAGLTLGSALASLVGLALGVLGLALAVIERAKNN